MMAASGNPNNEHFMAFNNARWFIQGAQMSGNAATPHTAATPTVCTATKTQLQLPHVPIPQVSLPETVNLTLPLNPLPPTMCGVVTQQPQQQQQQQPVVITVQGHPAAQHHIQQV